jgi:hypothetical protein
MPTHIQDIGNACNGDPDKRKEQSFLEWDFGHESDRYGFRGEDQKATRFMAQILRLAQVHYVS